MGESGRCAGYFSSVENSLYYVLVGVLTWKVTWRLLQLSVVTIEVTIILVQKHLFFFFFKNYLLILFSLLNVRELTLQCPVNLTGKFFFESFSIVVATDIYQRRH